MIKFDNKILKELNVPKFGGNNMVFNKNCKYFDRTRMDSKRVEKGIIGGVTSVQTNYHPCLSEENPKEWISECPDNCPYFEKK